MLADTPQLEALARTYHEARHGTAVSGRIDVGRAFIEYDVRTTRSSRWFVVEVGHYDGVADTQPDVRYAVGLCLAVCGETPLPDPVRSPGRRSLSVELPY
jgi:hypothetical protein